MEYIKRKLCRLEEKNDWRKKIPFPHYYEENGKIVKETADGKKYVVTLDDAYNEVIVEQIK